MVVSKDPFPRDKEEALKFSNDILQLMYDEKYHANLVKQLQSVDEKNKVHALGMMSANIIGDRIGDVRAQTGRPFEMKLAVDGTQAALSELTSTADELGLFKTTPKEEKEALRIAVGTLDQMGAQGGRQG